MEERFLFQTDTSEMERRWKVTLEAMKKEGIDCLFFGGYDRWCSGVSKYLTDLIIWNYPHYFLLAENGISAFGHSGWGDPGIQPYAAYRNFIENVGIPALPTTCYGTEWYPQEVAKIIKKYGYKKVGFPSFSIVPAPYYNYLTKNLPDVEFVDFTNQMDHIKAVKSPYEIGVWEKCVKLHDDLMACAPTILRVGRTEREVSRMFRSIADEMFSAELNLLTGAHAVRPRISPYFYQNVTIKPNDYFMLLIEVSGPSGAWAELGRNFKMGDPPSELMMKANADQIEIQDKTAAMMKPGVKASDVAIAINKMLVEKGYEPERRICSHGQGYDIVDRPIFVAEETMVLEENMFIAHHPNTANNDCVGYNCDNYLITKDGAKILSKTPRTIVTIDY